MSDDLRAIAPGLQCGVSDWPAGRHRHTSRPGAAAGVPQRSVCTAVGHSAGLQRPESGTGRHGMPGTDKLIVTFAASSAAVYVNQGASEAALRLRR